MSVTIQINGTPLNPQPASVDWESNLIGGKLNGTDSLGAYETAILSAPVDRGGTINWNWATYENQTLTSIVLPARFSTMRDTGTTYSSGVVSGRIASISSPPGGLVRGVQMKVKVVI